MYAVPKPGFDLETMRTVALAYRGERRAGRLDEPAREAALKKRGRYKPRQPKGA